MLKDLSKVYSWRPSTEYGQTQTMRRVVVTGLGAITPLGVGIKPTWRRLLAGESGITNIIKQLSPPTTSRWHELPSTVAGMVPTGGGKKEGKWLASDWITNGEERRMAKFTQYAIAAAEMALSDAGWRPETQEEKAMTGVCLGSGIGNFEEVYRTSLEYDKGVSNVLIIIISAIKLPFAYDAFIYCSYPLHSSLYFYNPST